LWSSSRPLPVQNLPTVGSPTDADLDATALLVLPELVTDASRQATGWADEHHARDRKRGGEVDDAAGLDLRLAHAARVLHRPRLAVLLHEVQVLDHDPPLGGVGLDDAALLATVLAGKDLR